MIEVLNTNRPEIDISFQIPAEPDGVDPPNREVANRIATDQWDHHDQATQLRFLLDVLLDVPNSHLVTEEIAWYVDDKLPDAHCVAIEQHLMRCDRCRWNLHAVLLAKCKEESIGRASVFFNGFIGSESVADSSDQVGLAGVVSAIDGNLAILTLWDDDSSVRKLPYNLLASDTEIRVGDNILVSQVCVDNQIQHELHVLAQSAFEEIGESQMITMNESLLKMLDGRQRQTPEERLALLTADSNQYQEWSEEERNELFDALSPKVRCMNTQGL